MMNGPDVQRGLRAIFASDMVGYSRLMEIDEAGTLARLKTHRLELVDPTIKSRGGRIVKTTGDGLLAEFASVIDAVEAALTIQRRMIRRNSDVPEDRRILFRIGLHLGDILIEDGDVFGDGVNIAARLQEMAEAGGICVSDAVQGQLVHKPEFALEDLGDRKVKNIARPIHAFRLDLGQAGDGPPTPKVKPPTVAEHMSVAVLPFTNMSGDAEQEHFVDGLTEDILTALSQFRELTVISRNSTFAFKGKAVNVPEFAKALNVRYVVEGSVRKAGGRVRITVQLIDASSDHHVWAARYDRELTDIFDIQDDVTSSITATVVGRVEAAEHERVKRTVTENMAAYECVLAAKVLHHRSNPNDNARARDLIERAIALDPDYAHAHAWRACIYGQMYANNWTDDFDRTLRIVISELETALSFDENDSDVHRILAAVHVVKNELDAAIYHQERALRLNPNDDLIVVQQGELLTWLGEPAAGAEWIRRAMRLNPYHPERFWNHLGRALFVARDYRQSIESFRRITRPDRFHHAFLAAALAMTDDREAAATHVRSALSLDPAMTADAILKLQHYTRADDAAHHREALLRAGFPQ